MELLKFHGLQLIVAVQVGDQEALKRMHGHMVRTMFFQDGLHFK